MPIYVAVAKYDIGIQVWRNTSPTPIDIVINTYEFLHRNNNHGANDQQFPIINLLYTPRGFHLRGVRLLKPQWTYLADHDHLHTILPPKSLDMTAGSLGMHRWTPTRIPDNNEDYDDPEVRLATAQLDRRIMEVRLQQGELWRQAAVALQERYRSDPLRQGDVVIIGIRLENWRRAPTSSHLEALRPSNLP